jgi:hypothetical protein
MAKKRTGLQSEIAGIFSGVPVPKKGGARSQPDRPAQKPDSPASKPSGSVVPKPVAPQPQAPVAPVPKKIEEPVPAAPKPKVIEIKAPEQVVKKIPKKIPRRRKEKTFAAKTGVSSSRQKAAITLLLFFSTVLVIVLLRPYYTSSRNTTSGNTPQVDAGTSSLANIEINWPVPPVYSEDLRDPMVFGKIPPPLIETSEDVVVRGIVVSEDRKYAVVGTNYLQEGGIVPGTKIKVKKINPNSVEFEEDGKTWTQKVEGEKR